MICYCGSFLSGGWKSIKLNVPALLSIIGLPVSGCEILTSSNVLNICCFASYTSCRVSLSPVEEAVAEPDAVVELIVVAVEVTVVVVGALCALIVTMAVLS